MNTEWFNLDSHMHGLPASAACHGTTSLPARNQQDEVHTCLGHLITDKLLSQVLEELKRNASPGIDGISHRQFSVRKETEIPKLVKKLRGRSYKCQPNRRVLIPKGYGAGFRSLGISCMVDKVAEGAVKWIMEPIYERIFRPESYGYRPGRTCHHAVNDLKAHLLSTEGGFIIDADLSKFFDSVPHGKLMAFIKKKVKDPVVLHAIWSFLNAGTLVEREDRGGMDLVRAGHGTPQGGVISPLLANIYLHYVLDEYIIHTVSPTITGGVKLFRYADDFICIVSTVAAATEVMKLLEVRLVDHGLSINLEKTKLVDYRRPDILQDDPAYGVQRIKFLGFNLEWELAPDCEWNIRCSPGYGRVQRALMQAEEAISKKRKRGYSKRELRKFIAEMITGFAGYYSLEGCEEEVNRYRSEMARLQNQFRL